MAGAIERVMRRVQHMVGVGRTTAPVNDTGAAQTVQLQTYAGIPVDAVPLAGLFGFSSVMPLGSDVTFIAVAGDASRMVGITTGHQASRPKGTPAGGTMIYDQGGSAIALDNAHAITIKTSGGAVSITAPDVFTSGNLHAGTGATGSFTTPTGGIVTVRDGIIVNIF